MPRQQARHSAASSDAHPHPHPAATCPPPPHTTTFPPPPQVYEAHGRASLEYGDVAEFNQCQTQLTGLYAEGVPGCRAEFTAYHMLYQTVHAKHGQNRALLTTWKNTPPAVLASEEVAHALQVRQAVFTGDYRTFFALYCTAPKLGRAVMDVLVPKMRFFALNVMVKAFRPSVSLDFVMKHLGFRAPEEGQQQQKAGGQGSEPLPGCRCLQLEGKNPPADSDAGALAACVEWAQQHGAVVADAAGGPTVLLHCMKAAPCDGHAWCLVLFCLLLAEACSPAAGCFLCPPFMFPHACGTWLPATLLICNHLSTPCLPAPLLAGPAPNLDGKNSSGKLFVPEDNSKVSHGDANMSLDDFLAKAMV